MTILRHSVENNPAIPLEYPKTLARLVPKFQSRDWQAFLRRRKTVCSLKYSANLKNVLEAILSCMVYGESLLSPDQVRCYPSLKKLADFTLLCESTVRRLIRILENAGVVEVIEAKNPETGRNFNNVYKITELAFLDWALPHMTEAEDRGYVIARMETLRATSKQPRLSIIQGTKGFETKKANSIHFALMSRMMADIEISAKYGSEIAEYEDQKSRILDTAEKEKSAASAEAPAKNICKIEGIGYVNKKVVGCKTARQTIHNNKTYITTHPITTSTAEKPQEKLGADVPISSRDMKELMGAYTAIMGRKVPLEERAQFIAKMLSVGTSVEEVKANIKLLQEDAVCRATTTSFTRMAVKPDQLRWWLESQRTSLENSFERGNLLGNPHIRGKFQTEPQAIREVFSKIDPILTQLLPDTATDELKRKFLDTLSGSQIRSFILLGEDISLPFKKWEAGIATEVLQAETPAVAPRIEVEAKIECVTTETIEQEPTEAVELPETPATSAVTDLHEAEPRKDNHKLQEMRNSIVPHLYKVFGTRVKSEVIFSFCKSLDGVDYGSSGHIRKSQLESDFARFARCA